MVAIDQPYGTSPHARSFRDLVGNKSATGSPEEINIDLCAGIKSALKRHPTKVTMFVFA